jgi:glycosyltransferase involved in cell wall biosynthesis
VGDLGITVPRVGDVDELVEVVEDLAPHCDIAMLYRAPLASRLLDPIRAASPATKVLFLPVDMHHVRMTREALLGRYDVRYAEEMRVLELGLVEAADATLSVSTVEAELLNTAAPGADVHIVPLLRETPHRSLGQRTGWHTRRALHRLGPAGRALNARSAGFRRRRDLVFLGGFAHTPNVDAVHWFVEEVLGLVRAAGVTDRFVIAGHGVPDSVAALARDDIAVAGYAPDLADLFATARMSVVPLRIGAGFKGKIVTSLSLGVPVVTTSVGVEGGGLVDGHDVLVADEPSEMAAQIVRLSRDDDLWQSLSDASYDAFRARFSHEAGAEKLLAAVGGSASRRGS